METVVGKAVIMDHPFMYDRHLIALVLGQTSKMMTVRYWRTGRNEWSEDESRRKIPATLVVLPSVEPAAVQKASDELASFSAALLASQKAATRSYEEAIAGLGTPASSSYR